MTCPRVAPTFLFRMDQGRLKSVDKTALARCTSVLNEFKVCHKISSNSAFAHYSILYQCTLHSTGALWHVIMPRQQFGPEWLKSNLSSLPDDNLLRCYSLYLGPFGQKSSRLGDQHNQKYVRMAGPAQMWWVRQKVVKVPFYTVDKTNFFSFLADPCSTATFWENSPRPWDHLRFPHKERAENQKTGWKPKKSASSRG
jgi:hypothetical protein